MEDDASLKDVSSIRTMSASFISLDLGKIRSENCRECKECKSNTTAQPQAAYSLGLCSPRHYFYYYPCKHESVHKYENHCVLNYDFILMRQENPLVMYFFDVTFLVGETGETQEECFGVRAILGARNREFKKMLYSFETPRPKLSALIRVKQTVYSIEDKLGKTSTRLKRAISQASNTVVEWGQAMWNHYANLSAKYKEGLLTIKATEDTSPKKSPDANASCDSSNIDAQTKSADAREKEISRESPKAECSNGGVKKKIFDANKKKKSKSNVKKKTSDNGAKKKSSGLGTKTKKLRKLLPWKKAEDVEPPQLPDVYTVEEFSPSAFRILLDYLHTGSCSFGWKAVPELISLADHFDIPELVEECMAYVKKNFQMEMVSYMLFVLEKFYWKYPAAAELLDTILYLIKKRGGGSVYIESSFVGG